jgi:hypothetical protein
MVWNVGYVAQALRTGGDLLYTDTVLFPFGADLRLHTYGLLQGVLAYPFIGLVGVVGAFNLVLIGTLFLNGAALYALIYVEVGQPVPALIAAVWAFLGMPLLDQLRVGRPSFASLWIVVAALLSLRSLLTAPRLWNGAALGLCLLAALLSDFQMVLFTGLWLGLYGLYRLWSFALHTPVLGIGRRLVSTGLMLTLAALIFLIPFLLLFYPALSGAQGYVQPSLDDMKLFSFRFWDYLTPRTMPLVYGYELFASAVVAVIMWRGRGVYRFWLASSGFILLLALGPYLQLPSGEAEIGLPFAAFSLWPPLSNFRTPYRLAGPALIGLGVVAGLALAHLLSRPHARRFMALVLGFAIGGRLVFALATAPIQTQVYPDYAIYRQIAAETGDFTLLEVPFGVRSGLDRIGSGGEILQYYQPVHGKGLLNGMIARLPTSVFAFYRESPALLLLSSAPTDATHNELAADFAGVLAWSRTRYVLVHRSLLTPEQAELIAAFLNRQPSLKQLPDESDLMVYRVRTRKEAD